MGMFSNYTYKCPPPDNRFQFLETDDIDEIVIGGTVVHTFELPFKWEGYIQSGKIIYKQGNTIIPLKQGEVFYDYIPIRPEMIHPSPDGSTTIIYVELSPDYTKTFRKTVLNTYCQVQLITETGEIYYDDPKPLKVLLPLDGGGITNEE